MKKYEYDYVRKTEEFYEKIKSGRSFYTTRFFKKSNYQLLYDYVTKKNEYEIYDLLIISEILFLNENISKTKQKQIFVSATKIAKTEDPRGYNLLGKCYLYGKGVEINKELGIIYLQKAAELDEPEARFILGLTYSDNNEMVSKTWFKMASNRGLIKEMCLLIYQNVSTFDIQKKPSIAVYDLIEKAENGDIESQVNLALHLLKGDEIKQNISDAHSWLSIASSNGSTTAKIYIEKYFENRVIKGEKNERKN